MAPKKNAKAAKKAQPATVNPPVEDPLPPQPSPKQQPKPDIQPPPVEEKPMNLPPKEPISQVSQPPKKEKTAENEETKVNVEENDEKAGGSLIKLSQFNNFPTNSGPNVAKTAMSEEEKKKLRELRFAGKHLENTFEISHVAETEKQKLTERAKRFNLLTEDEEELKKQKRAQRFNLASGNSEEELQKKIERAKRFGTVIPEVEEEKKKLRAAKFGVPVSQGTEFLKNKKIKQN